MIQEAWAYFRTMRALLALDEVRGHRGRVLVARLSRVSRGLVLRRWFFNKISVEAWRRLSHPSERLKIGVIKDGTYGDKLTLIAFLRAVRRQFPGAEIFVFDWFVNERYFEPLRDLGVYDHLVLGTGVVVRDLVAIALARDFLDLAMDNRYVTRVDFAPGSRAPAAYQTAAREGFAPFAAFFKAFPRDLDRLTATFPQLDEFAVMSRSAALDVRAEDVRIAPRDVDRAELGPGAYVTVHHGAGPTWDGSSHRQTKMWFKERWEEVIEHLNQKGLRVIQLGAAGEAPLRGAEAQSLGQASFGQSAAILAGAAFHLDTEGGLVHLAQAVGTKGVTLFGPTPAHFFKYAKDQFVQRGHCHACWGSKMDWQTQCPAGFKVAACMDAIQASDVIEATRAFTESEKGAT